jgi:hypothetical protein
MRWRPAWADDSLTVAHNTTQSKRIVPSAAFDGVYFIDRVHFENNVEMD